MRSIIKESNSVMSLCNFCSLNIIKKDARKNGMKVRRSEDFPNGDKFHEKYLKSWMMEISSSCVC